MFQIFVIWVIHTVVTYYLFKCDWKNDGLIWTKGIRNLIIVASLVPGSVVVAFILWFCNASFNDEESWW